MNITVFLGANEGDGQLRAAAADLGRRIAKAGDTLVYGGSRTGLMGVLAKSALEAKGPVIGVEPRMFMDSDLQLEGLTQLIVTDGMAERKARMIDLGDAFVVFPGGTGTLEEASEVMSRLSLGQLDAPCIVLNLGGYYDGLKAQLRAMLDSGLSTPGRLARVSFAEDVDEVAALIESERGA